MDSELKYVFEPLDFGAEYAALLDNVADAAVNSKGNIYALINGEYPGLVFDAGGRFLYKWGKGVINGPHGMYIDKNDYIYVADSGDHVVTKFTPDGKLLMTLGRRGVPSDSGCVKGNFKTIRRGAGPFNIPSKVTVSPKGEIFVADGYGNSRIHRFSEKGELLKSWGEPGGDPGQFRIPHGVAVDERDNVYVADRENDRVQIFDTGGNLRGIWKNIYRPDGLCYAKGLVYVAELGHRMYVDNVMYEPYENMPWARVRVFDTDGAEKACFGEPESWIPGNMFAPHSMNVDREGNIYVAEAAWPANESAPPENLHPALQKFRRAS